MMELDFISFLFGFMVGAYLVLIYEMLYIKDEKEENAQEEKTKDDSN